MLGRISLTSTPRADGADQRLHQLRIGNEVRVGDQDLALGAVDRRDQRDVDLAERLVGRAADRAHDLLALRLQRREVLARRERLALLGLPGLHEELLQRRDDRALRSAGRCRATAGLFLSPPRDPPLSRCRSCLPAARVDAADVDAAQHRAAAVDDEELAVVALVDGPAGLGGERVDRIELEDVDAGVAQALEVLLRRAERADARRGSG